MSLPYTERDIKNASPGKNAYAITVDDAADEDVPFNYLYVGTPGDIKVHTIGGEDVTFSNVPVGYLFIGGTRVWDTGTTADDMVGIY